MQQDSTHPTGVSTAPGEKPDSVPVIRARERKAQAALELRVHKNYSWTKIAKALGYPTARAAIVATERTLANQFDITDRTALRRLFQMRFEALIAPVVKAGALNPNDPDFLAKNKRLQEIYDRYIKLVGADMPAEVVMYSPSEGEIDQWVAQVVGQETKELEESDIFEASPEDFAWEPEPEAG